MAKAKILLVEDDRLQAKVTKEYLESTGYEVIWVEDGKSTIKAAKTHPVDLILLDLVLPDMDGNDVCRWLKLNQDTRRIPIIIVTVKNSATEKVEGFKAGADDYLSKPYNEIELNARIYACLRTKALQDELREKNRQLEEVLSKVEILAITDPLTELYNRRHFEAIIEKEFNKTVRYKTPTSCLLIDIDHFKSINDEYGHRTGDKVLKEIANLIKNCLRKVDTVARWGGEEFIVLLPETDKEQAVKAASRIIDTIRNHEFADISEKITASIGIASVPESNIESAEKLINVSDNALYEAKTRGRNRIEVAK
jgi:diguanylate cyclase (GGDEF)-like protein